MIVTHGANSLPRGGGGYTDFVEIGGRNYPIVKIANQWWMAENLDWKFANLTVSTVAMGSDIAASYYNGDESTYGINGNKYGLMYSFGALNYIKRNSSMLPDGWRLPSENDVNTLINNVGGASAGAIKLKSTSGWISSGGNGTDEFKFAGFPSGTGRRAGNNQINFYGDGSDVQYWISKVYIGSSEDYYYYLLLNNTIYTNSAGSKNYPYSYIRLVKDA